MQSILFLLIAVVISTSSAFAQARTPREVAEQLARVYGHKLDQVAYIPALPLVAKLRLTEITGDEKYAAEVHTIVEPFRTGEKSPVPKSGSEQAGHLLFAALAERSPEQIVCAGSPCVAARQIRSLMTPGKHLR